MEVRISAATRHPTILREKASLMKHIYPPPRRIASLLALLVSRITRIVSVCWTWAASWQATSFSTSKPGPCADEAVGRDRVDVDTNTDLRHTHAPWLIADGEHRKVTQTRLGHGSISVTMDGYGHLMDGLDDQIAVRLDARAEAAAPPSRPEFSPRDTSAPL